MPEYLAPGVFVEEVSFRARAIEGVPTSTTGFVGMARYGPVQYRGGPTATEPRLITSFTEFERVYGGLAPLRFTSEDHTPYLAHAARAFFLNGGKRLYVSRVFQPRGTAAQPDWGVARLDVPVGTGTGATTATWWARWPGAYGNAFVRTSVKRSKNVLINDPVFGVQARQVRRGAVVEIFDPAPATLPADDAPLTAANLAVVEVDAEGKQTFTRGGAAQNVGANAAILLVEMTVSVTAGDQGSGDYRNDVYSQLASDPRQTRYIGRVLDKDHPIDDDAIVFLHYTPNNNDQDGPASLMIALTGQTNGRLAGGHDGEMVGPEGLKGGAADLDDATRKATGLEALAEVSDIAIVAAPDSPSYDNEQQCRTAAGFLIDHAESQRFRIAIVDPPPHLSINGIRTFRGQFDSTYGALYHPWIEILDPLAPSTQGGPPVSLTLPPSGFVAGIYARSDTLRGVFKAPANEVVQGLTRFEANINTGRQEVLNPEGINALRFFEDRGNRVWGARTMSSDPEWKYVNVRRLFIFLEHSIYNATQFAVFEPNNERLWADVRHMVEDFLLVQWRDGALMGSKPEQAYFVRCDRTTMTQNDLDNGRLICLIGVAPTMPAEFVIFRIGQWTADAKMTV